MISNTYSELLPSPNEKTNKILDDSQNFWISTLEKQIKKAIKNQEVKSDINIKNIVQSMYATIVGVTILGKTNTSDKSLIESFHTHLSIFI